MKHNLKMGSTKAISIKKHGLTTLINNINAVTLNAVTLNTVYDNTVNNYTKQNELAIWQYPERSGLDELTFLFRDLLTFGSATFRADYPSSLRYLIRVSRSTDIFASLQFASHAMIITLCPNNDLHI
jgi:hypothetical protein